MSKISLIRNLSWMASISIIERLAGLFQTVLIARTLGITEYGIYGLIFGTIGLIASIAGLQLGLTATVFVSRYRDSEKAKAAFVIGFVNRFSIGLSIVFLAITIPCAPWISQSLSTEIHTDWPVIAGCVMVVLSIMSGVQDGIIQGFEDFRSVALVRLITTLFSLACIYPVGTSYGLLGVMIVVITGPLIKYLFLIKKVREYGNLHNLPKNGGGLSGKELLWGFSVPSMLASLLAGVASWSGSYILSRQVDGFDALAIVNTGLQWRGPVFLLISSMSAVAIPAMSRQYQSGNYDVMEKIHKQVLLFNIGISILAILVIYSLAPLLLKAYGAGFENGVLVFSILISSTLPQAVANVYLQELSAKGMMWMQNMLYLVLALPMAAGFYLFIPVYLGMGYALVNLVSWTAFSIILFAQHKYRNYKHEVKSNF